MLVFVALGAVVNVVIVIAICALQRPREYENEIARFTTGDGMHVRVERRDTRFATLLWVMRTLEANSGPPQGDAHAVAPSWGRDYIESPSPQFMSATERVQYSREEIVAFAVGWPMRAGWYESHRSVNNRRVGASSGSMSAQVGFGNPAAFSVLFDRALPTRVLWPGFIINSLLFGLVLWLLLVANPILRQRARLRRGLCPACSYPIGASAICSECGRVTSRA
jgi:hypothetical protein